LPRGTRRAAEGPEVVLMDVALPHMNGVEADPPADG